MGGCEFQILNPFFVFVSFFVAVQICFFSWLPDECGRAQRLVDTRVDRMCPNLWNSIWSVICPLIISLRMYSKAWALRMTQFMPCMQDPVYVRLCTTNEIVYFVLLRHCHYSLLYPGVVSARSCVVISSEFRKSGVS